MLISERLLSCRRCRVCCHLVQRDGQRSKLQASRASLQVRLHVVTFLTISTMMQLYLYTRASRELVLHYYAAMQQARVPPSAHTYKLLLDAYGTLEPVDIPGMERVFQQLLADKNVKVQGTHWASLILAYGSASGNVDRAIEIFESIATHPSTRPGDKLDPVVWEALLNVFVTSGRVDDLTAWFEKMKQSGARATAYVYNALIAGYSAAGRIEQAREVFESMSDSVMGESTPDDDQADF